MDRKLLVEDTIDFIKVTELLLERYKTLRVVMFLPNHLDEVSFDPKTYTLFISAFELDFASPYDTTLEIFNLLDNSELDRYTYNNIERITLVNSMDGGIIGLTYAFSIELGIAELEGVTFNNMKLPDGFLTYSKKIPLE